MITPVLFQGESKSFFPVVPLLIFSSLHYNRRKEEVPPITAIAVMGEANDKNNKKKE